MALIEKASLDGLTIYLSPRLKKEHGIVFCFTDRHGGYSKGKFRSLNVDYNAGDARMNVRRNREKILKKIGINGAGKIFSVRQVHGNRILNINENTKLDSDDIPEEADCIVTGLKNTPVMVMGADCNLILVGDIRKRVAAAVHAGWKGTLKKIAARTVLYIKNKFNSNAEDIVSVFGPSIRRCCYKVNRPIVDKFTDISGRRDFFSVRDDNIFLDLVKINYMQLREAGISEENISDCGECTYCNSNFYSYRRSKITGRQSAIAVII
jgi:polyphenol oxidase